MLPSGASTTVSLPTIKSNPSPALPSVLATSSALCIAVAAAYAAGDVNVDLSRSSSNFETTTSNFNPYEATKGCGGQDPCSQRGGWVTTNRTRFPRISRRRGDALASTRRFAHSASAYCNIIVKRATTRSTLGVRPGARQRDARAGLQPADRELETAARRAFRPQLNVERARSPGWRATLAIF